MNQRPMRTGWGVVGAGVALATAVALAGVANAQDAVDDSAEEASTSSSGGNVQQVPLAEMKTRGAAIVARIEAIENQISAMLMTAKEDRQVVRVLCLTDRRNQVSLALGTARDRQSSLAAALDRGADGRARHEFRLLAVVGENVELVSAEANLCLGGEAGPVGESSLDVEIDPNLPALDPGIVPVAPIVALVPLVASPTD